VRLVKRLAKRLAKRQENVQEKKNWHHLTGTICSMQQSWTDGLDQCAGKAFFCGPTDKALIPLTPLRPLIFGR
jgi:hypothetical protein